MPGSLGYGLEGELLLLAGRLVGARLRIALVLLRRRLPGCGLDLGVGRGGLLVFVAHVVNPLMKRPKNIFRYFSNMGLKRRRTR